ncbi:hypothetical protein H6504_00805 [Candidatus Woesearchaeota archaeon]|nr:hypothetical protein [Candidatus Woesearchaeota archaeon]
MGKKCIICDAEAQYCIKDSTTYYCVECARETFSDLDLLVKVTDMAQKVKAQIESRDVDLSFNQDNS